MRSSSTLLIAVALCRCPASFGGQTLVSEGPTLYRNANAPVERRLDDLLRRMTLEEKVRQLDMYSGATAIVDKHSDDTHATADAVFLPERGELLWGSLGVGAIH